MKDKKEIIDDKVLSRRKFIRSSTAGVAAAMAFTSEPVKAVMKEVTAPELSKGCFNIKSITIPKDLTDSINSPAKESTFSESGITGAEVFAQLCKKEKLAGLFCCAGNYTVINAMAAEGIPCYGGRTEGSMAAAADGFSRATGEVVAASGTEGPGFTNMIVSIASANAARTPLLVLASNMQISGEDREATIQNVYQQPTTVGMKKYGKRLITPNRVYEYGSYAFRHLKSGIPGPVHLDFPSEVSRAVFKDPSELTDYYDKKNYRTESRAYPMPTDIKKVAEMITKAKRPLLIAGQGVFQRKAWDALYEVMDIQDIAVIGSGPSVGHVPDDHKLSAGTANSALMSVDLIVFVGQYCMPSPNEWTLPPGIPAIRVNPIQEDIGRNWPIELGVVSDEKFFLEELANVLPKKKRTSWVDELSAARQSFEQHSQLTYKAAVAHSDKTGFLHPAVITRDFEEFFFRGDIDPKQTTYAVGGFTIGRFAARWANSYRPGQTIVCGYQYGAIGPEIAHTLGAGIAVQRGVGPQASYKGAPVVCITGDAGVAYSMFELDTANKYKIPMIVIVSNNDCWGTYGTTARTPQALQMYLFQHGIRYDKMAEGLGVRGEYVKTPKEYRDALARSYNLAVKEGISTLINCQGIKEFGSGREYPPGPSWPVEPGRGSVTH